MTIKVNAEITISGANIKNLNDCKTALEVMLGCYEDMSDDDTEISIDLKTK